MAMTPKGQLIDPYHGQQDLKQGILRHVSPAFAEDPVRILRVARFAARYRHLGFTLADETRDLMQAMVRSGEVDHLVAERVWAELFKALNEATPSAFFYTLNECEALAKIFPEIHCLFGVPQPEKYHPEIDTGVHVMLCVDKAARMSAGPEVRFASLVHDLGKGVSPKEHWPHHHGHEAKGLPILEQMCLRLRVPKAYKALAMQVMQYHSHCHRAFELRTTTLTDMLAAINAYKPDNNLNDFLQACEADAKGRTGLENVSYPQAEFIRGAAKAAANIDASSVLHGELKGAQIGEAIRRLRIKAIREFIKANQVEQYLPSCN